MDDKNYAIRDYSTGALLYSFRHETVECGTSTETRWSDKPPYLKMGASLALAIQEEIAQRNPDRQPTIVYTKYIKESN